MINHWARNSEMQTFKLSAKLERGRGRRLVKCCVIFYDAKVLFLLFFQDPEASYDFNDNDHDPFPRYDPTNENK